MLCLHKKEEETTKVGAAQHQEATYLKYIQFQVDMNIYSGALSALHDTIMDTFPTNVQINDKKTINLEIIGVMLIQNGYVNEKTWILLFTCSTDSVTEVWIILKM